MAIFPPQVAQSDLERIDLLRAELKRTQAAEKAAAADTAEARAAKKRPVPRPPLARALAEELRRFAKDEGGFSFIDWAITVSLISMAAGFFIPDLWALFQNVIQDVTNEVGDINTKMKMY